jgi:hypothetical protein
MVCTIWVAASLVSLVYTYLMWAYTKSVQREISSQLRTVDAAAQCISETSLPFPVLAFVPLAAGIPITLGLFTWGYAIHWAWFK